MRLNDRLENTEFKMRINNEHKLLFFIGSGRTGSTLLGQLLNYHPSCLISNESRFLDKVIVKKQNYDRAFEQMVSEAYQQYRLGLENTPHFKDTLEQYQSHWKNMSWLTKEEGFRKADIKLVGDKKAGGTTSIFRDYKDDFLSWVVEKQKTTQVSFLQLVRSPTNAAFSYMKSHGIKTFEEACGKVIKDTSEAYKIRRYFEEQHYCIFYEDLVANPAQELIRVLGWLKIDYDERWAQTVAKIVDRKTNCEEIDFHHRQIRNSMIRKSDCKILERYLEL